MYQDYILFSIFIEPNIELDNFTTRFLLSSFFVSFCILLEQGKIAFWRPAPPPLPNEF
jgi:hypothetical protein